jgi:hypothetical protein
MEEDEYTQGEPGDVERSPIPMADDSAPSGIPDIYFDGVQIMVSPFDIVLQLTEKSPVPGAGGKPQDVRTVAYTRTSLEHAKVIAILLRKIIKTHEDQIGGPIHLHPQVLQALGISPKEDW